jgi:hypothetical protein
LTFVCAYCFQINESAVDPSQGDSQSYIEDCQICCRPLVLQIHITEGVAEAEASAESE